MINEIREIVGTKTAKVVGDCLIDIQTANLIITLADYSKENLEILEKSLKKSVEKTCLKVWNLAK